MATGGGSHSFREALRLFLERVCCDLCRFEHVATEHIAPEDVVIRQEVALGPSAFADIQVTPRGKAPYFLEVDYGYTPERLIESLRRKYGKPNDATAAASKVVLVIDVNGRKDWSGLEERARSALRPGLALEVWDERRLDELVRRRFSVSLGCRAHVGVVGDAINLAARLCGVAQTHEIVVSNRVYSRLSDPTRDGFIAMEPVEAKNLGSVRAWKLAPRTGPQ